MSALAVRRLSRVHSHLRSFGTLEVDGRFTIDFTEPETVLQAFEKSSIFVKADCRRGECRSCVVHARIQGEAEWIEVCMFNDAVVDGDCRCSHARNPSLVVCKFEG